MPRPTKDSLQRSLLNGETVKFKDGSKQATVELATPQSRRLFKFLLESNVRDAKDLPSSFVDGLWQAYSASDDLLTVSTPKGGERGSVATSWRIRTLTAKNFGGLNVYGGPDFAWDLRNESWLLDGENGSGKSSLLGAVAWAFTGLRPRDESTAAADAPADVLDINDTKIGAWPPLACYPRKSGELSQSPEVEVTVELESDGGERAIVQRALRAGRVYTHRTVEIDEVFVSTGIAMPLVLPSLRLKEKSGDGALTRAVAQLTGLDDLVSIGELADGLCHGAREYSSYAKKAGLQLKLTEFENQIAEAARELKLVDQELPTFSPKDAIGEEGRMAKFATEIASSASSLAGALAADLTVGTDTSNLDTQRDIIVALSNASAALGRGLTATKEWKDLEALDQSLTQDATEAVLTAISTSKLQLGEALEADSRQQSDKRYRLKALASSWHAQHKAGPIEQCPLCEQGLQHAQGLQMELESLRSASASATQTLQQTLLAARESFVKGMPAPIAVLVRADLQLPRLALLNGLRREVGDTTSFGKLLSRYSVLVEHALQSAPQPECSFVELPSQEYRSLEHEALALALHRVSSALQLVEWFREHRTEWTQWWEQVAAAPEESGGTRSEESVRIHLKRLSDAMDGAKPYARAAALLGGAVKLGAAIQVIQLEQDRREKVAAALQPLKILSALSQSVARQAISDLSGRISLILEGMHTSERLRYRAAALQKREGLTVRGSFESELLVDATLIANSSWLRSVLWAFIFALRQEAAEQHGFDPLPVWLFDDPQTTFDLAHRLNWTSYVASLQTTAQAQVVIATHDETFAAKLRQSNLAAHEAVIKAATADSGPMEVLDGSRVERRWKEADADKPSKDKAIAYLSDARVYLEGMLKAMLAGQGSDIRGKSVSDLRTRMAELGRQAVAPWDKRSFGDLVAALDQPAIRYVHQSHHSDRNLLTFSEAKEVSNLWPKLARLVTQSFQDIRDYRLLHGMPSAFQLAPPSVDFPDGFNSVVAESKFPLLGRASAFSGRISEGTLSYEEYDLANARGLRLAQHGAFRLNAKTLEPVARPGDLLLVHEVLEPAFRSLVVAIAEDQVVARRYIVSEASSDVVVLTANAIDPYEIALPIVARRETIKARRVVGVLFDRHAAAGATQEVEACRSQSEISSILSRCKGLVEVAGQSAQPLALDGQYLLLGERVSGFAELRNLNGRPVIALDSENARYFKRLRLPGEGLVILESLDGGGEYPPEVMWADAERGRTLEAVWEVLGVLFERT